MLKIACIFANLANSSGKRKRSRAIYLDPTDRRNRRNHDVNRKLWRIFAARVYVCVSRALRENLVISAMRALIYIAAGN